MRGRFPVGAAGQKPAKKEPGTPGPLTNFNFTKALGLFHRLEAFVAVDWSVVFGNKGNLSGSSATSTYGIVHLSRPGITAIFPSIAAGFAPYRLILEAFLGVKFLFPGCENKFGSTVFANECFVFVHGYNPSL